MELERITRLKYKEFLVTSKSRYCSHQPTHQREMDWQKGWYGKIGPEHFYCYTEPNYHFHYGERHFRIPTGCVIEFPVLESTETFRSYYGTKMSASTSSLFSASVRMASRIFTILNLKQERNCCPGLNILPL